MNILPKKSWHVRNKDNVARVRRDEENARVEEEKLAKRAALAEQEARTKLLRDRVCSHALPDVHSTPAESQHSSILPYGASQTRNINLFEEEESGNVATRGTNTEYEAEKKAEQEKKEKALGVLKYLGQSTIEGETPWYLKKESKETTNAPKIESKDVDRKNRLDPLNWMNSFLEETKKSKDKRKEKKKKEKKHKGSKKGKKTIAELRAERLQREKEESLRAQKLILDSKTETCSKNAEEEDPYSGRYHSQYNPDLARKPKWNNRYHPY